MPEVSLLNKDAKEIGKINLNDGIFAVKVSVPAMHMVVREHLAKRRQGTKSAKTRSEVRGGGRKPWRQKGTGRARHGSTRSPIWRGGGMVFAVKPRNYEFSINKKLRRLALKSALTTKLADNELIVIDDFGLESAKTKDIINILSNFNTSGDVLIVTDVKDENVVLSARNVPGVKTTIATTLNVYDILKHEKFMITQKAAEKIQEVYV